MAQDRAGEMWRIKRSAYSRTDADIILASEHTLHMAERSPLGAQFGHVHRIPYGIATSSHLPESERAKSRSALGIPDGNLVLAFRATASEFKGLSHLIEALALERPARPTTLLTVDSLHLVDSLAGDYDIIELGWVREQTLYARFLSACDIFLMPSMAEAFGLMAAEAMAVGRPVICFEGTSLPEITFAPDCGVAVPAGDSKALRVAIDMLASSPSEAMRRGELGRLLAAKHYDHDDYLDSLVTVYRSVVDRRS
jgi:glycosyltransferase involved in cell wall biosynthesis